MKVMTDIAKEYGTALFMLACEVDKKKEYASALETIEAMLLETPEYINFLASPSIPLSERINAIENAFSDKVPEHLLSYLELLCEKGRIACLLQSIKEYKALLDASEHVSNATVTSAVELTVEEKDKLKAKLERINGGLVNINYLIDESLLGGIIVEIDGKIIDGSLRHRLREVKEVINYEHKT